ncbi:MAG: VOC family protein, partial [Bryobacteraceae bacterium]
MPPDFRLSKIGLIQLGVTDLNRSVEFYRDRLGLRFLGQSDVFGFFVAGGVSVALSVPISSVLGFSPGAVE